jgi:DNA mismatch endonuclease (patch repair protein)
MDHLTPERRSQNMAAIKRADTAPEMIVRRMLHAAGYRFRLHRRELPGKPDIVLPGRRAVVFVHGCFWHQHAAAECGARPPKSNTDYWGPKLRRNVERDVANAQKLAEAGWKVCTVWECETKNRESLAQKLLSFLG